MYMSDKIRMLIMRVANEKQLPFDVQVPNQDTIEAMEELNEGKGRSFNGTEDLFRDLDPLHDY